MNAQPFLITGLPRSRTAWLSVLCTTGNAICYHEPSICFDDIADLRDFYDKGTARYIGASDAGLGFFLSWILENIKPRTLIVDRDVDEVNRSLSRIGLKPKNSMTLLHRELRKFQSHPLVMWVPFFALERKHIVQKIFSHLMPGEDFDETRYEHLSSMNIQVDFAKKVAQIRKHKWPLLWNEHGNANFSDRAVA